MTPAVEGVIDILGLLTAIGAVTLFGRTKASRQSTGVFDEQKQDAAD
jgi:hypothetical protein